MANWTSITRDISVSVEPIYLSDQSAPEDDYYVWAYKVEIENKSGATVQIRSRFWRITDSFGRIQETRGMGVVGEQPVIKPGEKFEYTSGTPLQAPGGMMGGNYQMQTSDGDLFEVEIPLFSLDSPHDIKRMH